MNGKGVIFIELARIDVGLATFLTVQWGLTAHTIDVFGSEE
jgi:hypothetical protein